jgi:hypothetical protein
MMMMIVTVTCVSLVLYDDLESATRFKLQGCNQEPQAVWHFEENCDECLLASRVELQTFRE